MALFFAGALFALAGVALGREWLVDVALGLLVAGLLLRFLRRNDRKDPHRDEGSRTSG
jgi:hypothetical protein